ncbi:MAG: DNA mismatch repair protein MutS [Bacteroidota bacterium]
MRTQIEVGDTVETIDDAIVGEVVAIEGDTASIVTTDGFTFEFTIKELVKTHDQQQFNAASDQNIEAAIQEKESGKRKTQPRVKPKERSKPKFVVDLHIHQLTTSTKGMTKHDMLTLQLDTARRQLEFAIRKRIPNIVFIHGVGEGVLKLELQYLFGRYNNVEFYDADYQTYGLGATEVRIFQNKQP